MNAGGARRTESERCAEPFRNAEQAWFWTMASLRARHDGAVGRSGCARPRPCEPDDVIRCLDLLYRRRRIDLAHARALRVWGERQIAPQDRHRDAALWREALARLEWVLRSKGIVAVEGKNSLTAADAAA
jgi:hypothetical protein